MYVPYSYQLLDQQGLGSRALAKSIHWNVDQVFAPDAGKELFRSREGLGEICKRLETSVWALEAGELGPSFDFFWLPWT